MARCCYWNINYITSQWFTLRLFGEHTENVNIVDKQWNLSQIITILEILLDIHLIFFLHFHITRQEALKPGSNVGVNNPVYDRQDIDNQSQSTHYMTLDSVSSHTGPPPYTTTGSANTVFSALNPNYDSASVTPSQSSYLTPQPTTQ